MVIKMDKYAMNPNPKISVRVYGRNSRVSSKKSVIVCRKITGMNLEKAKKLLEGMLNQKQSIGGKYYTNSTKELLDLLNQAENNAEFKGLDTTRMIVHASAHEAFTYIRPRRFKMKRQKRKLANLQVVLMQK